MSYLIVNFLLFCLPLVIWPFGPSQFEIPKVILVLLFIDVLFIFVMISKAKQSVLWVHPVLLVLTALLVLLTIYHLLFFSTPLTFFGNQFRMQGVLLLWHLILLSVVSSLLPYRRPSFYFYLLVLAITVIGSLFLGNNNGRSVGTLGEPNALAAFVIFLWPFLFFARDINHKYRKYVQIACLVPVILIIFLSGSRSGLIAFIIQVVFYLILKIGKNLRLSMIIGFVMIGIVYILPMFENVEYENRSVIWHTAFAAGSTHPFTGGGFGNTELLLRKVITHEHNSLIGYYVDSSHNLFLDWWVQGGIAGVGILAGLFIFVIKNFYARQRTFELILFLGLLTVFSLNPASVVSLVQLWWLLGLGFNKTPNPSPSGRPVLSPMFW